MLPSVNHRASHIPQQLTTQSCAHAETYLGALASAPAFITTMAFNPLIIGQRLDLVRRARRRSRWTRTLNVAASFPAWSTRAWVPPLRYNPPMQASSSTTIEANVVSFGMWSGKCAMTMPMAAQLFLMSSSFFGAMET